MTLKKPSNQQVKNWKKLLMGKYRKREGLFLAEGVRCVEQILENGIIQVDELLLEKGTNEIDYLQRFDVPIYELESEDFLSISDTENSQGVIAVCQTPFKVNLDELVLSEGVIVATDAIQDPGNLGTMIRTASWFDVSGFIFGTGTVDSFHPKVVRSTAGATGRLAYQSGDLSKMINEFEEHGWDVVLMDGGEGSISLKEVEPARRTLIVVGNEGSGISGKLFTSTRKKVRIDGKSEAVESLNAAVALGIGLFQFKG
ncbi:MAG: RNA methyltransferase [Balneolaceae bacterium]